MINLSEQFPGKTAGVTPNYPFGQARNITLPGDGKGTPWDQAIANDIMGFMQAALVGAGMTPSGTPDNANNSQVLKALIKIFQGMFWGSVGSFRIPNPGNPENPIVVQYGRTLLVGPMPSGGNGVKNVSFNFKFPNACYFVIGGNGNVGSAGMTASAEDHTQTGYNAYYSSSGPLEFNFYQNWLAIGY